MTIQASLRLRGPRAWALYGLAALAVGLTAAAVAGEAARRDAEAELARQAEAATALHAAVLRSELDKHRALPLVLAADADVARLLASREAEESPDAEAINRKLETLAGQARAAVVYVIDARGVTRAASNWRRPDSFVGADYGFRPYFIQAMRDGAAEFFALGTVSGRPGLYLSRRVTGADGRALGVVVVKVEFDALEAEWRASGEPAWVVDPGGVVLITSVPEWRFRTLGPLDEARRRLTLVDQTLSAEALRPLPFDTPAGPAPALMRASIQGVNGDWMHAETGTATPGWTLHLLAPSRGAIESAVALWRTMAILLVAMLAGVGAIMIRRRQQALGRARREEAQRLDLERRIAERTAALSQANAALNAEIEERRRAEASRELLRDELVQASKLAALGQIVAGVAHEINQPVAAIMTQAETTEAYLDRGEPAPARRALARIGELTARIGSITEALRVFSRKSDPCLGDVDLKEAVDGALLLVGGRLRQGGVALTLEGLEPGLIVRADKFRLEQVVVNLAKNAAEAMQGRPAPALALAARRTRDWIELRVSDNGPGLSSDIRTQLFTPFVTSKPNGLGLGLVICRDIIAGFGGDLDLASSDGGAVFVVRLRRAG